MREKLLTIEEVAKRVRLSVGRTKNLSSLDKGFPPPRERRGKRYYYGREEVDYWSATRIDGRKP